MTSGVEAEHQEVGPILKTGDAVDLFPKIFPRRWILGPSLEELRCGAPPKQEAPQSRGFLLSGIRASVEFSQFRSKSWRPLTNHAERPLQREARARDCSLVEQTPDECDAVRHATRWRELR